MAKWTFWGEKNFSDVYENIYIRSFVEDWFGIVYEITKEINTQISEKKLILDIGCGEGHTTKQILDRVEGTYICDLLEPNAGALSSAVAFLTQENIIGEYFPQSLATLKTDKKYDVIFTSHTNYYWATNEKDYNAQLLKLQTLLKDNGKLLILTLPKDSGHYKIMLAQVYPEFNYGEYISEFYKKTGLKVEIKMFQMKIFVGDILTTDKCFALKAFYRFIHNTDSFPNETETQEFLKKIKEYQKDGYIDFKDHLIVVSK